MVGKNFAAILYFKNKKLQNVALGTGLDTVNKQMPQIVFACFLSEVIGNASELHGELGNEKVLILKPISSNDALLVHIFLL